MKRYVITSVFVACAVICGTMTVQADNISESEAQVIAQEFFASRGAVSGKPIARIAQQQENSAEPASRSLYVFNNAQQEGFVVIAGEESIKDKVLGYSDSGAFDYNNAPPALLWLLDSYSNEMAYMQRENKKYSNNVRAGGFTKNAGPLIESEWGQSTPYNNMCPQYNGTRCVTGCVATAISQIMYYHKYPEKGAGSNSYTSTTLQLQLSEVFSNTTYQWDKMTPQYDANSTTEACNAVAQIMYHAGMSVNMDYGTTESGAIDEMAARALVNNFSYDKSLISCSRDYYSQSEWEDMIVANIDNNLPIYYSGSTDNGGHAFIIDGYNSNGFVHVNWGWQGQGDGYFLLSTLDAYNDGNGYRYDQSAIFNIQPDKGTTQMAYDVLVEEFNIPKGEFEKNSSLRIAVKTLHHTYVERLNFIAGINITGDGFDKTSWLWRNLELDPGVFYIEPYASFNFNDLNMTDGTYNVKLVYSTDNGNTKQDIKVHNESVQMYTLQVKGNAIIISAQMSGNDDVYLYRRGKNPVKITHEKAYLKSVDGQYFVAAHDVFNSDAVGGQYSAYAQSCFENGSDESWNIEITYDKTDESKVWIHPIFNIRDYDPARINPVYAFYDRVNGTLDIPMGQCLMGSNKESAMVVLATINANNQPDTAATVQLSIVNNGFDRSIAATSILGAGDIKNNNWWYQALSNITYSSHVGYSVSNIDSISIWSTPYITSKSELVATNNYRTVELTFNEDILCADESGIKYEILNASFESQGVKSGVGVKVMNNKLTVTLPQDALPAGSLSYVLLSFDEGAITNHRGIKMRALVNGIGANGKPLGPWWKADVTGGDIPEGDSFFTSADGFAWIGQFSNDGETFNDFETLCDATLVNEQVDLSTIFSNLTGTGIQWTTSSILEAFEGSTPARIPAFTFVTEVSDTGNIEFIYYLDTDNGAMNMAPTAGKITMNGVAYDVYLGDLNTEEQTLYTGWSFYVDENGIAQYNGKQAVLFVIHQGNNAVIGRFNEFMLVPDTMLQQNAPRATMYQEPILLNMPIVSGAHKRIDIQR